MTFCSDNQNKHEIIKFVTYNKEKGKYIVYYLDGTYTSFNNSDTEYLKKIEEKMIKQALERETNINSLTINKIKLLILTYLSIILSYKSIEKEENVFFILGLIITIISGIFYFKNTGKIKELKKYRILLDNYKDFKDNLRVAKVIEFEPTYCDPLDIMSIDRYSLSDVKKMYKELKKVKDNQEYQNS